MANFWEFSNRSHAVGKRKCSIARIWLQEGQGQITVNGRPHVDYFAEMDHRMSVLQPFFQTSTLGTFDVKCLVNGGGLSGEKAGALLCIGTKSVRLQTEAKSP
jgi:small subunit ribosomal protein S9